MNTYTIHHGDALTKLRTLPDESVHCGVTSPPYFGLRDYGVDGQIGLEDTPDEYIARLVEVFREFRRVLRNDGVLWLNIGDSYNNFRSQMGPGQAVHGRNKLNGKPAPLSKGRGVDGLKEKDLIGVPWMLAFALRADGWYLRSDVIWNKPNPMPESVIDRPTKAHEYLFLLTKSARYYYDAQAIAEAAETKPQIRDKNGEGYQADYPNGERFSNGARVWGGATRNRRSVWTVTVEPTPYAHFATMPTALVEPCILAGCPAGGTVLDPFAGSGTTLRVAIGLGRNAIGIELNPDYVVLAERLLSETQPALFCL